jgi:membrane-bound lytic murein transglycosylase D
MIIKQKMTAKLFGFLFFVSILSSCQGQNTDSIPEPISEISLNGHFRMPKLPIDMKFAGERIDLSDIDIRERLDKELHAIVFYHNLIISYFKRANRFMPEIERILKENNIPDDFKYLALIESGYENVESRSGAHGFWQFMPQTGKEYGLTMNSCIDERQDLRKSTPAAAKYLHKAKDTLGSWIKAAASYNRGVAGVRSDQKWQHVDSYFDAHMNNETARYVFRMMAAKLIFENSKSYGYDMSDIELYPVIETKTENVYNEIRDVALWAKEKGINYKILVKLNPWILSNTLKTCTGGYSILLPADNSQYSNY